MGYGRVELAGFGDLPDAAVVREAVGEAGLELVATHVPVEFLRKDLDGVIRDTLALGTRRVVCPILPAESFTGEAACVAAGRELAGFANTMGAHGVRLSYHVHGRQEFSDAGGRFALHRMLEECPQVDLEIDVLWVARAQLDPAEYIRSWAGRCCLLHIKDMAADGTSIELGKGTLDLDGILRAARTTGLIDRLIVEQEHFPSLPPIEAAAANLTFLTKLLGQDTDA
jgi:sugar phosphate isomerase/epimerase